jgi:hypothetical protein
VVPSREHTRRNRKADLLCCFEIDDKLELLGLLHRQIGGLGTFQDFVHVSRGAAIEVANQRTVGHQSTFLGELERWVQAQEALIKRQLNDLF